MNHEWQRATEEGDLEEVRRLLESGAYIDAKDRYGQTALMNAAHAGNVELVRLLVERGADLDVTAKYNLSALMLALIGRHTEVARLLIEAGADVTLRGSRAFQGRTALSLAQDGGFDEIVELLNGRGTNLQDC